RLPQLPPHLLELLLGLGELLDKLIEQPRLGAQLPEPRAARLLPVGHASSAPVLDEAAPPDGWGRHWSPAVRPPPRSARAPAAWPRPRRRTRPAARRRRSATGRGRGTRPGRR